MTQLTDILIPLGKGSRQADIELKYCLRSIAKHLINVGRIVIVGERPQWLQNVVHVPCVDNTSSWRRAENIYRKVIAGLPDTTNDFLFMNDDHYLLADYRADLFPYYHRGAIELHRVGNEAQRRQMENTVQLYYPDIINDYDVHCPVIYNKDRFVKIFENLQWPEYGYGIKSMYCNFNANHSLQIINRILCEDLKFSQPLMRDSIMQVLEGRSWFSIGDACLKSGGMLAVLEELYPTPSEYEIN